MRVAIVGNGPSAAGHGQAIDACDRVVRIRAFWSYGALDVGRRTDAWAWFGSQSDMDLQNVPRLSCEHWFTHCPEQLLQRADGLCGISRASYFSRYAGLNPLRWLPSDLWQKACAHLGFHPSTGFITVALAIAIYQPTELHLYGFDGYTEPFSDARREIPAAQQTHHNMPAEKHAFAEISNGTWLGDPLPHPITLIWPGTPVPLL